MSREAPLKLPKIMPRIEKSLFLHQFHLKISSNDKGTLELISRQLSLLETKTKQKSEFQIKFFLNKVRYDEIPITKPNIFSVYPLFQASQTKNKRIFFNAGLRTIGFCIDVKKKEINTYFSQEEYFDKNLLFDLVFFKPLKLLLRYYKYFIIHCSCLAKGNDAILIPGYSGCGKTTIALSLLSKGFKYLSDDDTILRLKGDNVECLSLPTNPKIKNNLVKFFPEINLKFLKDAHIHVRAKKIIDIQRLYPNVLQEKAIPKIIIFPRYSQHSNINIKRLSKQEALNRLWRSDFEDFFDKQHKQASRQGFKLLSNLVRKTNAFELFYQDKDIPNIPELIERLLN